MLQIPSSALSLFFSSSSSLVGLFGGLCPSWGYPRPFRRPSSFKPSAQVRLSKCAWSRQDASFQMTHSLSPTSPTWATLPSFSHAFFAFFVQRESVPRPSDDLGPVPHVTSNRGLFAARVHSGDWPPSPPSDPGTGSGADYGPRWLWAL
ncbi:hypothetical protein B0H19DRAFT_1189927 [Mycena capillaripes]|nr:hypothetical protein B0H19DRAFT_1189927 [Mycena capillaripes]